MNTTQYKGCLMVQGTSSDAGKSVLVAGICRVLARRGLKVAPLKPQNMALNSAVTDDGGEIGRAQAVQAMAAGVAPRTDMNPVLLKPNSDTGAQVIIHGKPVANMEAGGFHDYKPTAMRAVVSSYERLMRDYQVVVVEGAGSPAEINLREGDIANMGFAEEVDCPVILVADIDKGGVFAQLVGTLELLSESEQRRIVGFVINRFRGDVSLLQPGLDWLDKRTGKPVLGVLPYLNSFDLAAEDAIDSQQIVEPGQTPLNVVVPVFSRISNHTDFDALRSHPQVNLIYGAPEKPLPAADLIILPGSKHVTADLALMKEYGWDKDIARHLRYGGKVLGICGGYQMLGELIRDPHHVEGETAEAEGLGWLPITTTLQRQKTLEKVNANLLLADDEGSAPALAMVSGYEIHMGITDVQTGAQPLLRTEQGSNDGCISADNQVAGCYLHGLFDQPSALVQLGQWLGHKLDRQKGYLQHQQEQIDRFADTCEKYLDWQKLDNIITNFPEADLD